MPPSSLLAILAGFRDQVIPLSRLALLTDVDGTISPITPTPAEAIVSPRCRAALLELSRKLAVVVAVSGRPAADVRQMVGLDGLLYVGNHGLDRWSDGLSAISHQSSGVRAALVEIRERFAGVPWVVLEDKGPIVAVHYRLAPDPDAARDEVLVVVRELAEKFGLRVAEGRRVVELRPDVEVTKGTAVRGLLEEHPEVAAALYLGDDLTDVDAFREVHDWAEAHGTVGLAVAVLSAEAPSALERHADYALHGVAEVEEFLEWLAGLE